MKRVLLRLVLLAAVLLVGCPAQSPPRATPPAASKQTKAAPVPEPVVWQQSKTGVGFRLSDAEPLPPAKPKLARAKPLDETATARVMARLPRLKQRAERKSFALRAKSPPAPRPGETIQTPFPPPVTTARPIAAEAGTDAALRVLRYAPVGDLETAPNLSVTFSAPMVEVTSHAELAKQQPPVILTPQPPGKWRWIGTQTVLFEPEERFPRATDYHVRVPASTRSVAGQQIDAEATWQFRTPTLIVRDFIPQYYQSGVELDPPMFAEFNQRIDRETVLRHMELWAGNELRQLRLLSDEEVEVDPGLRNRTRQAVTGQWMAMRATAPLPRNTLIRVIVKAGTPSAEGPKLTEKDQPNHFQTYGPLRVMYQNGDDIDEYPPLAEWTVRFNNPLDADAFDASLVTVTPELPAVRVRAHGSYISVKGRSKGRTTYQVRIGGALRDQWGQTLGTDAVVPIRVTAAEPMLFPEQDHMLVLDPAFDPKLSVFSVNRRTLRIRLFQVTPEHWDAYLEYRNAWEHDEKITTPPGRMVANRLVHPRHAPDELVETQVDLGPALTDGHGQVVAVVETVPQPKRDRWGYARREWVRAWVQVTRLGLQAFWDYSDLHAWVTRLADGTAVSDAQVQILPGVDRVATSANGIAHFALGNQGNCVVARSGSDLVMLPGRDSYYSGAERFTRSFPGDELRWFVYDDRHLYKPGEKVRVKGWIRHVERGQQGDVRAFSEGVGAKVSYQVYGARGNKLAEGEAELDESAGFFLAFKLPKNANLGSARVELLLQGHAGGLGRSHSHGFEVQEFRRPEYEVTADVSEGPHLVGGHAIATVTASYYAGGGLADAETKWVVRSEDAFFVPPNRSDFHFGKPLERLWWRSDDQRTQPEEWNARTQAGGKHRLRIDFDALDPAYPRKLDLEATVTDVNRQAWTARGEILVHPGSVTVGLRQKRRFVRAGTNLTFDVIATDLDGKAVEGRPITVKSARVEWEYRGGGFETKLADEAVCELSSAAEPGHCSLPTKEGGPYRVVAEVRDRYGRPSHTRLDVWVLGEDLPRNPNLAEAKVQIIPDRKEYAGGQTAELLVMAPFAPAEGVLTLRRDGLVELRRFKLEQTSQLLRVPIEAKFVPNVIATVNLVGAVPRENASGEPDASLPRRPAYASGSVDLSVPPLDRTLDIQIAPLQRKLSPGSRTRIALKVRDATGRPVRDARLAVVAVDEAVLALAGYELPDPLAVFYSHRPGGVEELEMRYRVALSRPDPSSMHLSAKQEPEPMYQRRNGHGRPKRMAYGAQKSVGAAMPPELPAAAPAIDRLSRGEAAQKGGARDAAAETPIAMRTDFRALAVFKPNAKTDASGHAEVSLKLPDSLTRYRVMAVAASGENQFGAGESAIVARLPLMVRPSPPRFLNFGDQFELPVVLQNQTSRPLTVSVVARADNLRLFAPFGQQVVVPADDRVEVRFPAAAQSAGTARLQVGVASTVGTDASEHELPVWTPATTEAFATYGQVDQGAVAQKLRVPRGVVSEFGGLEITTSSTALQGLTDAVLYLVHYPFECNEQRASRVLAIAALRDVLTAFQAEDFPSPRTLLDIVKQDLEELRQRQNYSGGWDYWSRNRRPVPYVSLHVTHALVRAKAKGFKVPEQMLRNALGFTRNIQAYFPPHTPESVRHSLTAYSLFIRHLHGDPDAVRARKLIDQAGGIEKLNLEAIGWILPVLSQDAKSGQQVAAIRQHLLNRVSETAGNAHFVSGYGEDAHLVLYSERRVDGILLEALILDQPGSDLIPKLVTGLLAHRKRGRWYNTQENVFILLALDRYFNTYEKVTPDFVARAWVGDQMALSHEFRGRSNDRQHVDVPMSHLLTLTPSQNLLLSKEGPGRLYYRMGMQYAPSDLRLPPAEHGFAVSRVYEGVDDPDDVRLDGEGIWHVKAGATVRVKVNMVARGRRYHVALVDPLPAGFEPLNPALATTGSIPDDPDLTHAGSPWWWNRTWYEHQNLRDDRAEAFASLLWAGVYDYTYAARATTPGRFVVPPPKAEEMYAPETFGRGKSDIVLVQ